MTPSEYDPVPRVEPTDLKRQQSDIMQLVLPYQLWGVGAQRSTSPVFSCVLRVLCVGKLRASSSWCLHQLCMVSDCQRLEALWQLTLIGSSLNLLLILSCDPPLGGSPTGYLQSQPKSCCLQKDPHPFQARALPKLVGNASISPLASATSSNSSQSLGAPREQIHAES